MYEMTASFMLYDGGIHREALKTIPEFFQFLKGDGYLTAEHGKKMRDWFGGSEPLDIAKKTLQLAANQGTDALKEAWGVLTKMQQKDLAAFKDTLKDLAAHADQDRVFQGQDLKPLTDEEKAELAALEEKGLL